MKTLNPAPGIELPLKLVTSTCAILANRGEGKTHIARVMAEEMISAGAHVIAADPTGSWWGLQSSASGKRAGLPVVIFGGEHADVPIGAEAGAAVADAIVDQRINAVLDMSGFEDDGDRVRFMLAFGRRLFFINRKPVHIFLDEADEFVPQQVEKAPDKAKLLHVFKRIWQRGRVKGIGGTLISQRSAVVNKTLLNLSTMLIALKTVGPTDRDALAGWVESFGTDEQQKEFNAGIGRMPKHEAFWFSSEFDLFKRATARKLKTFDSSATPEVDQDLVVPTAKSDVDIKRLGAALEAAVEKVKADDPIGLRKRIAELEKAVTKANNEVVHSLHTQPVEKIVKVPTPIFGAKERKTLEEIRRTQQMIAQSMGVAAELLAGTEKTTGELVRTIARIEANAAKARNPEQSRPGPMVPPRATVREAIRQMAAEGAEDARTATNGTGLKDGASRRLLVALAQYGQLPAGRLRVLAGIGSLHTYRKYIGAHRAVGRIEGSDPVRLTKIGREVVGQYEPLPTGHALIEHWKRELGTGIMPAIFAFLLDHPDSRWSLDAIGQKVGTESAHTLRKYIGRLKTYGLVESDSVGTVQIAEEFKRL